MQSLWSLQPDGAQLDRFRDLIAERTGIFYPKKKDFVLEVRIQKLLRASGVQSVDELLRSLQAGDPEAWDRLVKAVTTSHTFFFREAEHFTRLTGEILRRKQEKPLIWVAAAATGEEVYSIAMSLFLAGIHTYFIMASDINMDCLVTLKKGDYPESRLRTVPDSLRSKFFTPGRRSGSETVYRVKPILKSQIAARCLNLSQDLRFQEQFDYIFCRNALMYFRPETQERVVRMLETNLRPQGILFTGHSENLFGYERLFTSLDVGMYEKKGGA